MNKHRKWIRPLARFGYAARGAVYLVVGLLAVFAVVGTAQKTGPEGAVETIFVQPLGTTLIWLLVIGLVGYVCWRLIQSLLDTDDHGWKPKGLAIRIGLLASAFTYGTLAVYALSLTSLLGGGSSDNQRGPAGDFLAGIIGNNYVSLVLAVIFAGVAISHWYKAFAQKYADHFQANEDEMKIIHPISMVGLTARGLVFAGVSVLLFYRYRSAGEDEQTTPGIKDVMDFVQSLPAGDVLLVALGIGIILFACYSFIEAKWRRINVEDAG